MLFTDCSDADAPSLDLRTQQVPAENAFKSLHFTLSHGPQTYKDRMVGEGAAYQAGKPVGTDPVPGGTAAPVNMTSDTVNAPTAFMPPRPRPAGNLTGNNSTHRLLQANGRSSSAGESPYARRQLYFDVGCRCSDYDCPDGYYSLKGSSDYCDEWCG